MEINTEVLVVEVINPAKKHLEGRRGRYIGDINSERFGNMPVIAIGDKEFVIGFECYFVQVSEIPEGADLEVLKKYLENERLEVEKKVKENDPQLLALAAISSLCRNQLGSEQLARLQALMNPEIARLLLYHACDHAGECGVERFVRNLPKDILPKD